MIQEAPHQPGHVFLNIVESLDPSKRMRRFYTFYHWLICG